LPVPGTSSSTSSIRTISSWTLSVTSSGAGNVDLGGLDATDATVIASGIGNIDISAHGKVGVTVSGVGNVALHRKPEELNSRVSGVGSVEEDY
jgi:hypothetical protein